MSTNTGDSIIATADGMFDDEFQRAQFHRSMTVGMYGAGMAAPFVAAILALFLPRETVLLSFLAFAPSFIGEIAGSLWLRRSVPRPKKPSVNRPHVVVVAIGLVLWIAAFAWRLADSAADILPAAIGSVVGAIIGIGLVALLVPRFARMMHRRDQRAIDRRLDADDEQN